jgi:ABC-type multidrug transport system ATPase subunit/ABC-type multidrug transport system permease subunit
MSATQAVAMGVAPIIQILFTTFAGFMVPFSSIPVGWQWMYYISYFTYSIKGLAINELFDKQFTCNPSEYIIPGVPGCQVSDGHSALQLYDMDSANESDKWINLLNLVWFFIAWNVGAAFALLFFDYSAADSSELPNFDAEFEDQAKSPLKTPAGVPIGHLTPNPPGAALAPGDDIVDTRPSALVAEPVIISWNNLSYIVDVPLKKKQRAKPLSVAPPAPVSTFPLTAPIAGTLPLTGVEIQMAENKAAEKKEAASTTPDVAGKRTLLQEAYGYAKPGMMVALMGGSGAGKTTLLDVLAGKKTGGEIINPPLINGKLRDSSFSRIAGYVEQFDSHDETATIREAIEFSAMLRLPSEMPYDVKIKKVDSVIHTLHLDHMQHEIIGNYERGGVSPELRKKVTIAVELVMDPGLLFLDEPTTGLDSAGALAVMYAVRRLSKKISVVCTIHQPSIEIVNCFTHVLLLNKWESRGRVAYFGPLVDMPGYFHQAGLGQCPPEKNIAEFGLEQLRAAEKKKVNPADLFNASPHGQRVLTDLKSNQLTQPQGNTRHYDTYAANLVRQVYELSIRFYRNNLRDKPTLRSRFGVSTLIALLMGTLYYQSSYNQKGAANRVSLMYLSVMFPMMSAMAKIPSLISSRQLYFREKNSQMYSPFAYYLGRILGDLPYVIMESLIYTAVLYWLSGMRGDYYGSHYGMYLVCFFIVRSTGIAFVELFSGLTPEGESASSITATSFTIFQLFAGFLIKKSNIPTGWIWMHYLSMMKYSIGFLVANELDGLAFSCPNNDGAISLTGLTSSSNLTSLLAAHSNIYW